MKKGNRLTFHGQQTGSVHTIFIPAVCGTKIAAPSTLTINKSRCSTSMRSSCRSSRSRSRGSCRDVCPGFSPGCAVASAMPSCPCFRNADAKMHTETSAHLGLQTATLKKLGPFGRYSKTLMLRQLSSSFPRGAKRGAAHNRGARQALGPPLVQGSGGRDNSCELQSTAPTHPTQRSVAASCASTSTNTEVLHLLGMWPHALTKKPWIGKPTCNRTRASLEKNGCGKSIYKVKRTKLAVLARASNLFSEMVRLRFWKQRSTYHFFYYYYYCYYY